MSMDYPEYLKICEKSRVAGWLWRIGDTGYYFGILGAGFALCASVVELISIAVGLAGPDAGIFSQESFPLVPMSISVLVFVAIFFISVYIKQSAYRVSGIREDSDEQSKQSP